MAVSKFLRGRVVESLKGLELVAVKYLKKSGEVSVRIKAWSVDDQVTYINGRFGALVSTADYQPKIPCKGWWVYCYETDAVLETIDVRVRQGTHYRYNFTLKKGYALALLDGEVLTLPDGYTRWRKSDRAQERAAQRARVRALLDLSAEAEKSVWF